MEEALLIGGGKTNSSFLELGVIDEVVWSIHPLVLGNGIKVFTEIKKELNLELLEIRELEENLVHLRYKVN